MTSFARAFLPNHDRIVDTLDVPHGLLPKLLSREVLSRAHVDEIKAVRTAHGQAEKLLQLLERRSDNLLPVFCNALVETGQSHIVKLLCLTPASSPDKMPKARSTLPKNLPKPSTGGQCNYCGSRAHNYGMPWKFSCFIKGKETILNNSMYIEGNFYSDLKQKHFFASDRDVEEIKHKGDRYAQIEELVSRLKRCDDDKYELFIDVLENNNGSAIAQRMRDHFADHDSGEEVPGIPGEPAREVPANDRTDRPTGAQLRRRPLGDPGGDESRPSPARPPEPEPVKKSPSRSAVFVAAVVVVVTSAVAVVVQLRPVGNILPSERSSPPTSQRNSVNADAAYSGKFYVSSSSFDEMFKGKRTKLANRIPVSPDLWTLSVDKMLLTDYQAKSCKKETTDVDKINCMIDCLVKRDRKLVPKFCDLMVEIDEKSIVDEFFSEHCKAL